MRYKRPKLKGTVNCYFHAGICAQVRCWEDCLVAWKAEKVAASVECCEEVLNVGKHFEKLRNIF